MAATVIEWKRGDSFVLVEPGTLVENASGTLTMNVNGASVPASYLDMAGWTVKSQIRNKATGELVSDMAFSWLDQSIGSYQIEVKDTSQWPLATLAQDIEFTDPIGYVSSSETIYIRCKIDQTRA